MPWTSQERTHTIYCPRPFSNDNTLERMIQGSLFPQHPDCSAPILCTRSITKLHGSKMRNTHWCLTFETGVGHKSLVPKSRISLQFQTRCSSYQTWVFTGNIFALSYGSRSRSSQVSARQRLHCGNLACLHGFVHQSTKRTFPYLLWVLLTAWDHLPNFWLHCTFCRSEWSAPSAHLAESLHNSDWHCCWYGERT